MRNLLVLLTLLLSVICADAQQKNLTDEQIVNGLPDGILNIKVTGGVVGYPSMMTPSIPKLVEGWENPTYSPDSSKIAYTLRGDLYSIDVDSKRIVRHTFDGSDLILNGYASWVYYEEILGRSSRYKSFWWSPDSKMIAFYRYDNSGVPMFPIYDARGQHGSINRTRYPKCGDTNPQVKVGFVSVNGGEIIWADFDEKVDQYFGIPFWNGDGDRFMVGWMDRSQDNYILYSVDPQYGNKYEVYKEHQDSWIDWPDHMLFTKEGIYMVRDYSMWEQIYFLSYDGSIYTQLTNSNDKNWGVRLLKVDKKYLFYTSKSINSTRNDIFRINLRNNKIERVSFGDYDFSQVRVSEDNSKVYATISNCKTPYREIVINIPSNGNLSKVTVETKFDMKGPKFEEYKIALPEIIEITLRDGKKVPSRVIWPIDMDRSGNTKYPVKVNIYGGPNSQQVYDRFAGVNFNTQWWANHGVIQVVLESRSAGHLGKEGLNDVYRRLAGREIEDFIDGIKHYLQMPFVNPDKIGIEGFSFGGTMTTLCVTEGNDYFKYGIAGGGVYDWSLYDSHYTERYMDRPQDNPEGYSSSAVLGRVSKYRGDDTNMLRLTHGTGDDNVHFQNTLQLMDVLHKDKKNFEFMIYPQAMHGYRGYQGRHSQMQDMIFWYRYLLDSRCPQILLDK